MFVLTSDVTQEAGAVEGTVRAAGGAAPLSDVMLMLEGSRHGALSNSQGFFR